MNILLAQHYWEILERDYPEMLGDVNPLNDLIKAFQVIIDSHIKAVQYSPVIGLRFALIS